MLRTIVEGEPGIFPEPVARLMRGIGGLFRRKPGATGSRTEDGTRTEDASDAAEPNAPRGGDGGRPDGGPSHSGDST